jgi:hypothetical protein
MLEKLMWRLVEIGDALRKIAFRPMFAQRRDGFRLEFPGSGADGPGVEGDWASR